MTSSAAIPILKPPQSPASSSSLPPPPSPSLKKQSKLEDKKLCRNIVIYGQCRFEGKGCLYAHQEPAEGGISRQPSPVHPSTSNASVASFSVASAANAAIFVPISSAAPVPASSSAAGSGRPVQTAMSPLSNPAIMAVTAQEFVPRRSDSPALSEDSPFYSPPSQLSNIDQDPLHGNFQLQPGQFPSSDFHGHAYDQDQALSEYYGQALDLNGNLNGQVGVGHDPYQSRLGAPAADETQLYMYPPHQSHSHSQDPYYSDTASAFTRQPLQYHLYHPASASTSKSGSSVNPSFFLPSPLHTALTEKSEATQATPSVDMKLPADVGGYTGLFPLDKSANQDPAASWAGYRTWLYKAWKADGRPYVLRRIEGFRLQHEAAISLIDKWARIRHPGIVSVREAFTTKAFADQSIIFVYDFYPCAATLYESHLSPNASLPPNPWGAHMNPHLPRHSHLGQASFRTARTTLSGNGQGPSGGVPEKTLWSYIVQIASAIKAVHNAGLSVRTLDATRILITSQSRVRLGSCGVLDVIAWDGNTGQVAYQQQDDLLAFGKLIVALACGAASAVHNLPKSVDFIARSHSAELKNVVLYLLSKPSQRKSIEEVLSLMGGHVLDELNASLSGGDSTEAELMRELENGRLVRVLTKFGFINERPEFDHDPRWAETGDRYIIKLFRDFVFHQVDENGRPVTDLSHVITSLNKLDAGVDEKIMLVSRDEQSCLIVSYREVKNCIETAFLDLTR